MANGYHEEYRNGEYSIKVNTTTPHVAVGADWMLSKQDGVSFVLHYGRQTTGTHYYDVVMQNTKVKHLDFQQAFAPYAYRAADLTKFAISLSWEHRFDSFAIGLTGSYYSASGERLDDVAYTGTIGYASTAPMISPFPDVHKERRGSLSAYVKF